MERFDHYRDKAIGWEDECKFMRVIALAAVLLNPLTYWVAHERSPVIGIDSEGRAQRIPEITERAISDAAVARFCTESVSEIGTFGFHDFALRFSAIKGRFTIRGWRGYNDALMNQKIPEAVRDHFQTYATVAREPCSILDQGVKGGRYWWTVSVPVVRTVTSGQKGQPFSLTIEMDIVRVGNAEAKELVAIDRWRE